MLPMLLSSKQSEVISPLTDGLHFRDDLNYAEVFLGIYLQDNGRRQYQVSAGYIINRWRIILLSAMIIPGSPIGILDNRRNMKA